MTAPQPHRCGVLLAGGASSRFGGRPKGLEPLGTIRMADHVLGALHAVCDQVVVCANDPDADDWFPGHALRRDVTPGRGALGALESALHACDDATIVVCAWDMPFVTAAVLHALAAAVDRGEPCAVPRHDDGRLEPLCAAYSSRLAPGATALLDAGIRAAHQLVHEHAGLTVPVAALVQDGDPTRIFFNVNTPADLHQAIRWLAHDP